MYQNQCQNQDPQLTKIFQYVDKDRSGLISSSELQQCLSNGSWEPFHIDTIKLLMSMFDINKRGQLNFNEFQALWKYVNDWQAIFKTHDRDGSGSISRDELNQTLTSFGYRLSNKTYDLFMTKFDRQRKGDIYFDDFIQCLVALKMLTEEFSKLDTDRDGFVNFGYEQFINAAFSIL